MSTPTDPYNSGSRRPFDDDDSILDPLEDNEGSTADDAQAAWIVRNSWGTGWGDSGYCLIGYGQDDVLIDSSFAFYSLTVDVQPQTGCGAADYVLVDKHFGGAVVLWAYAGGAWRHKVVTDAELAGVAQELFAATRADVCWDGDQLTLVRAWKTL